MRIGLIAPPWVTVPPTGYGGTEAVIANLARGLVDRGHDVRLFTVGTSTSASTSGFLFPEPVQPLGQSILESAHVLAAYESLGDVDVIHDHTMLGPLLSRRAGQHTPPVVTTNHGPFTDVTRRILRHAAATAAVVAISADQASRAGEVPIAATIHHGIDLEEYRVGPGNGGHLVFVGRMSPDKGVHRAIRIARASGRPLRIIAKMREPEEYEYFKLAVRPLLCTKDEWPAELPAEERIEVMGSALGLINPISWPEPFGLVMAESLAVGTPVIAFPAGAAREIVEEGRTGFLREDERGASSAVDRLWELDRATCRASAESRFSVARMAADHERLYVSLLDRPRIPAPRRAARTVAALANASRVKLTP